MHQRNRHQGHYDFDKLIQAYPELKKFTLKTPRNDTSIDFSNPEAVQALNRALLKSFYGISHWAIPSQYLCPPIPGRSDYIHHMADLLSQSNDGEIPRGESVRVLDIGVGSSCIYPLIGHSEYDWSFVGTDTDTKALASAQNIIDKNKLSHITLKKQSDGILKNVVDSNDFFDFAICNPPFHASLADAQSSTRRKWKNLGLEKTNSKNEKKPVLNFGGQNSELWREGGEARFADQMIEESRTFSQNFFWFSILISKQTNLLGVYRALNGVKVNETKTIKMGQGQKISRFVAWTFLTPKEREEWKLKRWR